MSEKELGNDVLLEDERLACSGQETEREWKEATSYVTNLSRTKAHVVETGLTHDQER
jgi:hypothetical protein